MRIVFETTDERIIEPERITELSLNCSADAACDALSLYFKAGKAYEEITAVKCYDGDSLIFNGLCDCQKTTENSDGFTIYIFARSTASLLVDNEAEPYTYTAPSGRQLCYCCAEQFGFSCGLPDIFSNEKYQVSQGTSCYGAINQFAYFCTGSSIYVTPENEIKLLELSKNIKSLNSYKVLSSSSVINRSEPLTEINFKKQLNSNGYELHTRAKYADDIGIKRSQYINLNTLARWQRDYMVLQKLKNSYNSYKLLEVIVEGYADDELYQRFSYFSSGADYDDYALIEKRFICDKNGTRTRLKLRKIIDIKENTYVD